MATILKRVISAPIILFGARARWGGVGPLWKRTLVPRAGAFLVADAVVSFFLLFGLGRNLLAAVSLGCYLSLRVWRRFRSFRGGFVFFRSGHLIHTPMF